MQFYCDRMSSSPSDQRHARVMGTTPNGSIRRLLARSLRCCGVDYAQFRDRIFADRRGQGLLHADKVVRGKLGIMQRWADFFFASVRQQLVPFPEDRRIRSGAGCARPRRRQTWGSDQQCLSLATGAVLDRSRSWNQPTITIGLANSNRTRARGTGFFRFSACSYHFMLHEDSVSKNPLFDESGHCLLSSVPGYSEHK